MENVSRIKELEDELSKTKYNKRTQHHIGLVKAKLARLKEKETERKGTGNTSGGYSVRKSGDATAVLLGFPSVGKSTLLNKITNANSEVGEYAFTTLSVIPGMMEHKHSKIQVLDVPGIVEGAATGRGRGREVLAVLRSADLAIVLIDVNQPGQFNALMKEVYDAGLRLNRKKPDVIIRKTSKGGLSIGTTMPLTKITKKTIEAILKEYRILNADVVLRTDINDDEFIDVIEGNKKYIPGIFIITKSDTVTLAKLKEIENMIKPDLSVSAHTGLNMDMLKDLIFEALGFVRVYCKEANKKADLSVPLIMMAPATIESMCVKLHKDFIDNFKFAKIWGRSAKFEGQIFHKTKHTLADGDIVELHIK